MREASFFRSILSGIHCGADGDVHVVFDAEEGGGIVDIRSRMKGSVPDVQ